MKYFLIDMTTVETTRVLAVARLHAIQLLGRLAKAQGLTVIAPPLEGRSFGKLSELQMQYLYWSLCQQTPPETYPELVGACLRLIDAMPLDATPIEQLEHAAAQLEPLPDEVATKASPGDYVSASKPPKEKVKRAPAVAGEAPKPTTTTGLVWILADKVLTEQFAAFVVSPNADWKPVRSAIIAVCTEEGINEATSATQYSKWKAAKLVAPKP